MINHLNAELLNQKSLTAAVGRGLSQVAAPDFGGADVWCVQDELVRLRIIGRPRAYALRIGAML